MSRRVELINELVDINNKHKACINKDASVSRKPMSKEDRQRVRELEWANDYLRKAQYHFLQAMAGDKPRDLHVIKQPILAVRCHKCRRVYMAMALGYGVDEERSQDIKDAVARGDEFFITEKVAMQMCSCDECESK